MISFCEDVDLCYNISLSLRDDKLMLSAKKISYDIMFFGVVVVFLQVL